MQLTIMNPAPSTQPDPVLDLPPRIHTYHCLCTHLILATTSPLPSLARRRIAADSGLDHAYILPLPARPPSSRRRSASDSESENSGDEREDKNAGEGGSKREKKGSGGRAEDEDNEGYALLISTVLDRRPRMVVRGDGFERRYLQRCGRCRVVVGYQLDKAQFSTASTAAEDKIAAVGEGQVMGRREDVVFLLPGGLVDTPAMERGEMPEEKEVSLGWDK